MIDPSRLSVIAHRGASLQAPENTMAAFRLAMDQGASAIEFDVKLSRDRKIVIHHDLSVDRTTDGFGLVKDKSYSELKDLDAGKKFGVDFIGEPIPLLRDVFEALGGNLVMNIELTNYGTPFDGLADSVVDLVKLHGLENSVLFSSFNFFNLLRCKKLIPQIPCGALIGPRKIFQRIVSDHLPFQATHPWKGDVDLKFVEKAHKNKKRVHVWTVNDEVTMKNLKSMGVDGIFTDDPESALKIFT